MTRFYRGHPIPDNILELREAVSPMGIQVGYAYFQGNLGMPWEPAQLTVCDSAADGYFRPAKYCPLTDMWLLLGDGLHMKDGRVVEAKEGATCQT